MHRHYIVSFMLVALFALAAIERQYALAAVDAAVLIMRLYLAGPAGV